MPKAPQRKPSDPAEVQAAVAKLVGHKNPLSRAASDFGDAVGGAVMEGVHGIGAFGNSGPVSGAAGSVKHKAVETGEAAMNLYDLRQRVTDPGNAPGYIKGGYHTGKFIKEHPRQAGQIGLQVASSMGEQIKNDPTTWLALASGAGEMVMANEAMQGFKAVSTISKATEIGGEAVEVGSAAAKAKNFLEPGLVGPRARAMTVLRDRAAQGILNVGRAEGEVASLPQQIAAAAVQGAGTGTAPTSLEGMGERIAGVQNAVWAKGQVGVKARQAKMGEEAIHAIADPKKAAIEYAKSHKGQIKDAAAKHKDEIANEVAKNPKLRERILGRKQTGSSSMKTNDSGNTSSMAENLNKQQTGEQEDPWQYDRNGNRRPPARSGNQREAFRGVAFNYDWRSPLHVAAPSDFFGARQQKKKTAQGQSTQTAEEPVEQDFSPEEPKLPDFAEAMPLPDLLSPEPSTPTWASDQPVVSGTPGRQSIGSFGSGRIADSLSDTTVDVGTTAPMFRNKSRTAGRNTGLGLFDATPGEWPKP